MIHDNKDQIVSRRADVLIKDDRIAQIEADLSISANTKVIDCSQDIIAPGFVDTHHHVWQTQQKGVHADQFMLDYLHSGISNKSHKKFIVDNQV